jgi:hypothetical protein
MYKTVSYSSQGTTTYSSTLSLSLSLSLSLYYYDSRERERAGRSQGKVFCCFACELTVRFLSNRLWRRCENIYTGLARRQTATSTVLQRKTANNSRSVKAFNHIIHFIQKRRCLKMIKLFLTKIWADKQVSLTTFT